MLVLLVLICKYCCCKLSRLCVCNIASYLCCMCMYVGEHVCRPSLLCNLIDKIDNNNNQLYILQLTNIQSLLSKMQAFRSGAVEGRRWGFVLLKCNANPHLSPPYMWYSGALYTLIGA